MAIIRDLDDSRQVIATAVRHIIIVSYHEALQFCYCHRCPHVRPRRRWIRNNALDSTVFHIPKHDQ